MDLNATRRSVLAPRALWQAGSDLGRGRDWTQVCRRSLGRAWDGAGVVPSISRSVRATTGSRPRQMLDWRGQHGPRFARCTRARSLVAVVRMQDEEGGSLESGRRRVLEPWTDSSVISLAAAPPCLPAAP